MEKSGLRQCHASLGQNRFMITVASTITDASDCWCQVFSIPVIIPTIADITILQTLQLQVSPYSLAWQTHRYVRHFLQ